MTNKHNLSDEQCLVAHFDRDGNTLPQCRVCSNCGEMIEYPYNSECKGNTDTLEQAALRKMAHEILYPKL